MTRFNVTGKVTITVTTIVEAESEAEACAVASERYTSGSWQDTGNPGQEWVHDDLDGEPEIVSVTRAA